MLIFIETYFYYTLVERPVEINGGSIYFLYLLSLPLLISFMSFVPLSPSLLSRLRRRIKLYLYLPDGTGLNSAPADVNTEN
jgi:hypothetical protein